VFCCNIVNSSSWLSFIFSNVVVVVVVVAAAAAAAAAAALPLGI